MSGDAGDAEGVQAEVAGGLLRGLRRRGIRRFTGIPYAAPPIGQHRFAPPRPVESWRGLRPAIRFAEWAPQAPPPWTGGGGEQAIGSEDCLYLNVYAPDDDQPHPVLVWIHGGGGIEGSPNDRDATELAHEGVVVVTFAYRLGVLGLLYLPELSDSGGACNLALQDQVAALRWVSENVAAFGGDADRVTIGGQSAGGRFAGNLLGAPSARGLYSQALVMSGTGVGSLVLARDEAMALTDGYLKELGLGRSRAGGLLSVPCEELLAGQDRFLRSRPELLTLQAVIDGVLLPEAPLSAVADGDVANIPVLIGTTHDEFDYFAKVTGMSGETDWGSMLESRAQIRSLMSKARRWAPPEWRDGELLSQALTIADWRMPAIRLADAQAAAGGEVWMYRNDWRFSDRAGYGLGSPHGLDLGLLGDLEPDLDAELVAVEDRRESYHAMIASLRSKVAGYIHGTGPGGGWPVYDVDRRRTFIFDDRGGGVRQDPDARTREMWPALPAESGAR